MTSNTSGTSYQAVRCSCCSEPIPLSTLLVKLFVTESDDPNDQYRRSQVFILRCEACSKESCYLKSEIETFESESLHPGGHARFGPLGSREPYRRTACAYR
jgi:hypothetical protein